MKREWSQSQVKKFLQQKGLALSAVDGNATAVESFLICLLQHSTGQFSTFSTINQAIEFVLPDREAEQIHFKIRLAQLNKKYSTVQVPSPAQFFKDVISLLPATRFEMFLYEVSFFDGWLLQIETIKTEDKLSNSGNLWQDGINGLFKCVIQRRRMFKDEVDYIDALLRDVIHLRDLFYCRLEVFPDKQIENEAIELATKLRACEKPADYLSVLKEDGKIKDQDKWKILALEELVDVGQLSEEAENDLREEIIGCLAQAAEDSVVKRKKDYETARRKVLEQEIEKQKHNRDLAQQINAAQKEIAEMESDNAKKSISLNKTQEQLKQEQQKAEAIKSEEQRAKQLLEKKNFEYNLKAQQLAEQKAAMEREIKSLQEKERRELAKAKEADRGIQKSEQELDSINQFLQNQRAKMKEIEKSLNQVKAEESQLKHNQQKLMDEMKDAAEQARRKLQNLNINQERIQQLTSKREVNAWRNLLLKISQCIPPYNLVKNSSNSFIRRVKEERQLRDLVEYIIEELELQIDHKMDVRSYVANLLGTEKTSKEEELRASLIDLVAQPKYDLVQQPWRVSGPILLLSQIKEHIGSKCQEIHICASRVIYVDCDWTIPGTSVAVSAPHVRVVGAKRTIDTSGLNAEEFCNRQASHAERNGESGSHGADGAAGGSAGHFSIDCAYLSNGKLQVLANGGFGADGQHGGNGAAGLNGTDGRDGEISSDAPESGSSYFGRFSRLKYFSEGSKGEAGTAGGNGGHAGVGGQGGYKGIVSINIRTSGRNKVDCVASNGASGHDGNPGKGGSGGSGGRNGVDRAKVYNCSPFSGYWTSVESGDLYLNEQKNIFGGVIGYEIDKRSNNRGRASNGENGHRGKSASEQQGKTATPKKSMSKVQNNWSCDVINSRQQQKVLTDEEVTELSRLETNVHQIENERVALLKKEREIEQKLNSVKKKKEKTDQMKKSGTSAARNLEEEAAQLEIMKQQTREELLQHNSTLKKIEAEATAMKKAMQSRQVEVEQVDRFTAQLDSDLAKEKSRVAKISAKKKQADSQVNKTKSVADSMKSSINKAEKTVMEERHLVQQISNAVADNAASIEQDRQHRLDIEEKKKKLASMEGLKDKILSKARIVTQHRVERIAYAEADELPLDETESLLAYSGTIHNLSIHFR